MTEPRTRGHRPSSLAAFVAALLALLCSVTPTIASLGNSARLVGQNPQQLTPEEAQALDRAVTEALSADQIPDSSTAHISERIKRWSFVLVRAPRGSNDFKLAETALARAQQDLKVARTRSIEGGSIDAATRQVVAAKLADARTAIQAGQWVRAEQAISFVLDQSPNYPVALSLMDELRRKKRVADLKQLIMLALLGVLLVAGSGALVVYFGKKGKKAGSGGPVQAVVPARTAVFQVIDGIGRGKFATVDANRPMFRIGAAMGSQPNEVNDLVISDSAMLVSRYHCTIVRQGEALYLFDSSTNGTAVNGRRLQRGEQARLMDGDEITIADVSRLKLRYQ